MYVGFERSNALRLTRFTEPPMALAGESGDGERVTLSVTTQIDGKRVGSDLGK